jgi:hypothetical protein
MRRPSCLSFLLSVQLSLFAPKRVICFFFLSFFPLCAVAERPTCASCSVYDSVCCSVTI